MERLTLDEILKLVNKAAVQMELDNCKECSENYKQIAEYLEELKSYKDLEEQGLLVRLPCKTGDMVYVPTRNFISELKIKAVYLHSQYIKYFGWELHSGIYPNLSGFSENKLGKTVFLTREEAEKKLEELRN